MHQKKLKKKNKAFKTSAQNSRDLHHFKVYPDNDILAKSWRKEMAVHEYISKWVTRENIEGGKVFYYSSDFTIVERPLSSTLIESNNFSTLIEIDTFKSPR